MKLDYQPILSKNEVTRWIEICAWCDDKKIITDEYLKNKWIASHGICKAHRDEVLLKLKKTI